MAKQHLFFWIFIITGIALNSRPPRNLCEEASRQSEHLMEEFEDSLRTLYTKNYIDPTSSYEVLLVEHMQESLKNARQKVSKLNQGKFRFSLIPLHHLLNNLCTLTSASYLQSGLLEGEMFVSALYGNISILSEKRGISLSREDINQNACNLQCQYYLNGGYQINLFSVEAPIIHPLVDLCFCDFPNPRSIRPQETFLYLNDVFAPVFMLVIDDWGWDFVRKEVFQVFDELCYKILFESEIPPSKRLGNGQYVAVIKK